MVIFVRDLLVPGSISFLIFGLVAGLALLYRQGRLALWGRRWLAALVAAYGFMSMPLGANLLAAGLDRGYGSLSSRSQAAGVDAVLVLSGGSLTFRTREGEVNALSEASAFRTLEAARVYHLLDDPWVIVSGGVSDERDQLSPEAEAMSAELIKSGVPAERILMEPASQNTFEQAVNTAPILGRHGIERFVLVTSPAHMWRALATFRARGMDAIPSVAASRSVGLPEPGSSLVPSTADLLASQGAMREYLALVLYWGRGWMTAP